jgi:hypothetical protein
MSSRGDAEPLLFFVFRAKLCDPNLLARSAAQDGDPMWCKTLLRTCGVFITLTCGLGAEELKLKVTQLTNGPHHHFFGYIGQSLTTPWNASGRYILSLRTTFHDRMPDPHEAADVVLIDTHRDYRGLAIEKCRAWNFQQGTMFY